VCVKHDVCTGKSKNDTERCAAICCAPFNRSMATCTHEPWNSPPARPVLRKYCLGRPFYPTWYSPAIHKHKLKVLYLPKAQGMSYR
jgi:hypothetical protein